MLRTRSVVRDLSREMAMAAALEESEVRFQQLFAKAPAGIALIGPEGAIEECNDALGRLIGREPKALRSLSLFDLVAKGDVEALKTALSPEAHAQVPPLEVHLASDEGPVCTLFVNRTEGSDGKLAGFVVHFIDSTEQKNLERQFAQSQKMQAVGQLAGGIAHDFNNLLTAMIGFSDLLLLRHRPGDQSFADIMQIKQNANRAANLVRQLLAFSRQQTLQPRLLNLTDILAELSHLLRRLIGENIELKMSHGRDLGMIKADQGQLEQVIINLAVNARDAMPEGGVLTIQTGNEKVEKRRKSKDESMPPGSYTVIEVLDSGIGIPPENLDRIFDPFFTTKDIGEGTGVGLAVSHRIVEAHDGRIRVDSTPGQGAVFTLVLPASDEETAAEPEGQAADSSGPTASILIIDDEPEVAQMLADILAAQGHKVVTAESGEKALSLIEGQRFDVILSDVRMPKLDGPSLYAALERKDPALLRRTAFVSGDTLSPSARVFLQRVQRPFIEKPFNLEEVRGLIAQILAEPPQGAPQSSPQTQS